MNHQPTASRRRFWTGIAIAALGAVLFSTKAIFVKLAYRAEPIEPIEVLALRMLFSLPFYLYSLRRVPAFHQAKAHWKPIFALGIVGYYLSSLFDFWGLRYISAGIERLILFLYPSFVVLLGVLLRRQRVSVPQRIALMLTYLGILFAVGHEATTTQLSPDFYKGATLVFLCSLTYAAYIFFSGDVLPKVGTVLFTNLVMLVSIAAVLLHYVFTAPTLFAIFHHSWEVYVIAIAMAFFSTVLPSFLTSEGIQYIGSGNVAIVNSLGPVSTIVQAYFVLGEPFSTPQLIGTVLVLIGVLWMGRR